MTDADAFASFVRQYQDMVYATAVRLLGHPADAEDVAQAVFLKAFEHAASVVASPAAAGWLKTTTVNLCLNVLTRYRRRWRFFSELGGGFDRAAADGPTPAAGLERADRQRAVEQALRRLPDRQRVPLVLFHFEEQSYEQIAAALGVSVGKIKTDIHRGRQALRKELAIFDGSR